MAVYITLIPKYAWLRIWKHKKWWWGALWGHPEYDALWYGVHLGLFSIALQR